MPHDDKTKQYFGDKKEGIPYQTLVSSVLHKYVDGRLVEKND